MSTNQISKPVENSNTEENKIWRLDHVLCHWKREWCRCCMAFLHMLR